MHDEPDQGLGPLLWGAAGPSKQDFRTRVGLGSSEVFMKGQVVMAPTSVGLYNPSYEHDSCGVAMVVVLSLIPATDLGEVPAGFDKLEHFSAYAALAAGAEEAVAYPLLSAFIRLGCRAAIAASKRI